MGEFRTFEDLECWKACRKLRLWVARWVKRLPKDEKYRLGDQVLRAGRSATSNIAEGYGRYHYQGQIQFCRRARGSACKVLDHVLTGAAAIDFPPSQPSDQTNLQLSNPLSSNS